MPSANHSTMPTGGASIITIPARTTEDPIIDEDGFTPDLSNSGPVALAPGAFQRFYNDQNKLSPALKAGYIILMMADVHNHSLKTSHEDEATDTAAPSYLTPEDFARSSLVLSKILGLRGYTKKLILGKKFLADELKRRAPEVKPNFNNTKLPKFMELLIEHPITDPGDISFIKSEYKNLEERLAPEATSDDDDGLGGPHRITMQHRLRFLLILVNKDEVLTAYRQSTNDKSGKLVDYQGTDMAPADWKELMSVEFNESDVEYKTKALPNLHDRFAHEIECKRDDKFKMTPDKCKSIIQEMKTKLRKIIDRYNQSGNGSEMASFDDDSDVEDNVNIEESEHNYIRPV